MRSRSSRARPAASDVPAALAAYQDERETEALKLQSAARNRMRWFEDVARYTRLPPWQFTYSLLTGSQRIGHANLKLRDPAFVADVEARLADRVHASPPRPPMFLPFELRGMKLENRIVVSPMAQYSAKDGMPDDWHLVHLGARATGGAGLVFTEMTCVSPRGAHLPGMHRDSGARRSATPGGASSTSRTRTAARSSACSSAIRAARVRRSSAGKRKIDRCRPATGRRWRRRHCRISRASAPRRAR